MLLLFNFIALICSSTRANNEEIEFSTGADLPHPNLVPVQPPPPLPTDLAMTEWRHHVFLNFRGPDVRHSFSDHLYSALVMKGIKAFRDDRDLPRGENITEAILRAIEESKMSIVVLSRGYASSEWCLDELVKIMQTMREKKGRHYAFPVFYKITPDQVSDLSSGCYKDQFDRHKRRFSYHRNSVLSFPLTHGNPFSGSSFLRRNAVVCFSDDSESYWNIEQGWNQRTWSGTLLSREIRNIVAVDGPKRQGRS
ncbi:Disease resistance protein RUN1 [Linum perenne]